MKTSFITKIALLFSVLVFESCETVADCITGVTPTLVSKDLNTGTHFHQYSDDIVFEMNNAYTSNYYISDVEVDGNLPPGITYSLSNYKTIHFSGKPTTMGKYEFTIEIILKPNVDNNNGSNNMCSNHATQSYAITVI